MITGVVTPGLFTTIPIRLLDSAGRTHQIDALVDTGYDGALVLPPALVNTLGLPWKIRQTAIIADGSTPVYDVYQATVIWDNQPRSVEVDAVDFGPLVGTRLLHGHKLSIHMIAGGSVVIEALP